MASNDSQFGNDHNNDQDSFVNLARIQSRKHAEDDHGEDNELAYFNTLPDATEFETKEDTTIEKRSHLESDERILRGIIDRGIGLNTLAKKSRKAPLAVAKPEVTSTMPTISESEE